MNKSQLVDALADRLGDRRTAAIAVDALLQIVVDTVRSGDSVSLAGFGVFESRARSARTGRNPRTGEAVDVPATTVPAFRPGTGFRNAVAADAAPAAGAGRKARGAAATNGASGAAVATTVNGSADLEAPATATVLTDAAALTSKGKKKAAKDTKDKPKKGKKGKK
jgi:DNA-binding protein HU-beta